MQSLDDLSKERLISDLVKLRQRINELEKVKEEKEKYGTELAQTNAMFEGLFQFAPDAISPSAARAASSESIKRQGGCSAMREELIGLGRDVVVSYRFQEKQLEDRKQYMSAPHVRRMGTGLELYDRRKDGSEFPVDISLGPLQAKDEMVTLAVVRDITERRRAEEALLIRGGTQFP